MIENFALIKNILFYIQLRLLLSKLDNPTICFYAGGRETIPRENPKYDPKRRRNKFPK